MIHTRLGCPGDGCRYRLIGFNQQVIYVFRNITNNCLKRLKMVHERPVCVSTAELVCVRFHGVHMVRERPLSVLSCMVIMRNYEVSSSPDKMEGGLLSNEDLISPVMENGLSSRGELTDQKEMASMR